MVVVGGGGGVYSGAHVQCVFEIQRGQRSGDVAGGAVGSVALVYADGGGGDAGVGGGVGIQPNSFAGEHCSGDEFSVGILVVDLADSQLAVQ